MAAPPKASVPVKKPGTIGGFKWYVWAGGAVVAIAVGLYLRNKLGGSSTSGTSSTDATPVDTSGGASSSPDDTSNEDLAQALNGLTTFLGSGGTIVPPPTAPTESFPGPAGPTQSQPTQTDLPPPAPTPATSPGGPVVPAVTTQANPTPSQAQVPGQPKGTYQVVGSQGGEASLIHPAVSNTITGENFGGITEVKRLANGATLTTFATGRQVEQVPGKTAYVVKK